MGEVGESTDYLVQEGEQRHLLLASTAIEALTADLSGQCDPTAAFNKHSEENQPRKHLILTEVRNVQGQFATEIAKQ